jgi:oxygen-independent coproporphyrinogen-3 oxidase
MADLASLYCHIPFCHTICPFCAFAVHGNREALHGPYIAALQREIRSLSTEFRDSSRPVVSLYFGGGTPSTMPLETVGELVEWIARHFELSPDVEVAFELNPEDATPEYLSGLREAGINRASLGIQSLHGVTLSTLRRNHGPQEAWRAIEAVRKAGPANHNLDLMYGTPGIAAEPFREDVARLAATRPPHISLYGLDLEPHTLFGRDPEARDWVENGSALFAGQYLWASRFLTAQGYRHYEVSNFCLPGREGRQNLVVWDGREYLGFGLGAHSHVAGTRRHNERHLRAYLRRIERGEPPIAFRESLTREKRANEALMLSLRRDTGLAIEEWEQTYGFPWEPRRRRVAERLAQEGRARWDERTLALTAEGLLVADAVTAELMVG